jgi:multiple sugar transport system substrate-binding protein
MLPLRPRTSSRFLFACCSLALVTQAFGQKDKPLTGAHLSVALRSLPEADFIIARIPQFEERTGVKVQVVTFPEQQLRDKLVQDVSSGAGQFQVIAADSMTLPEFAEAQWITPLDELIKQEQQDYDVQDISPGARGLLTYKGKLYALPVYAEITQLIYRKDLFKEARLKVPATVDELIADAKKFTDKLQGEYGIALRGLRGFGMNMYIFSGFLLSYGGQFLSEKDEPIFNNADGVRALKIYSDLLRNDGPPGEANFSRDDVENALASETVAMIIEANTFYTRIDDPEKSGLAGKIGYAVVPAGPHGTFPAPYCLGLAVSTAGAKSDQEKKAAAEFILWATSYDMQLASIDAGIVSQTHAKVLSSDKYKAKVNPEWLSSTAESWRIANGNYIPRTIAYRAMGDIIGAAVQEVIAGEKSPQDALDQAAYQTTEYLKKTRRYGTP